MRNEPPSIGTSESSDNRHAEPLPAPEIDMKIPLFVAALAFLLLPLTACNSLIGIDNENGT